MDRLPRFYYDKLQDNIVLSDEQVNHLNKSLRLKVNQLIEVFDGKGNSASYKITNQSKKLVNLEISSDIINQKKEKDIILIQSLVQPKKLEEIVKKSTPLNLSKLVLIESKYSQLKSSDISSKKIERLEKISIEECKQSGNNYIPEIIGPVKFNEIKNFSNSSNSFIATTKSSNDLKNELTDEEDYTIIIGPEGDFNDEELKQAIEYGFKPITFHNNVLRTELASTYILSIFNFL